MNGFAFSRARVTLLLLLVTLCVATIAAGAAPALATDSSPSPSSDTTTLRIGWTLEPDNLNPFIGWQLSNWVVWQLNYDTLVGYSAADQQPVPRLATSWEHSPDGKTWTFKLRDDVTWQDGEPFTAKDVAFTFNYAVDNQMGNVATYVDFIEHVAAVDDHTVRFECSQPKANILSMFVNILPEHIWSKIDPKNAAQSFKNSPPIVGTGPFQITEFKRGEYVKLVANPDYWGPKPNVDEIIFQTYQNPDTMAADLKTGAIQGAWDIPTGQFDTLGADPTLNAIEAAVNGWQCISMNCYDGKASLGNPVLRDPAFRAALQWAIDKQSLVDIAYFGHGKPATTIVRSDYYPAEADWHWQPPADQLYSFDPEKAKAALDAAGYQDTDGDGVREYKGKPIELRLWAPSSNVSQQTAGKMLAGWFKDIGLKVKFSVLDYGAMLDGIYNFTAAGDYAPDFDLHLSYITGDPDPNYLLSVFTTQQISYWSDTAWSNAEYDRLFKQQSTTIDPAARRDLVHQMQQIVYEQSPLIPLVYNDYLEAYNTSEWSGWVRSPAEIGDVVYAISNNNNFVSVQPAASTAETSGSGTTTWIVIGVVVVAVVTAIALLLRRRGARAVEHE